MLGPPPASPAAAVGDRPLVGVVELGFDVSPAAGVPDVRSVLQGVHDDNDEVRMRTQLESLPSVPLK